MPSTATPQPWMPIVAKDNNLPMAALDPMRHINPHALLAKYKNLKLELVELHNALDTAFTPGHDALAARCEMAEARLTIANADLKTAMAREESAKVEVLVLKARLESDARTKAAMQVIINDKAKQLDLLKRRIKALILTEQTAKQKITELQGEAKGSNQKIAILQAAQADQHAKIKQLQAKLEQRVADENKFKEEAEKLTRMTTTARAACNTLEERLQEERVSAQKEQEDVQRRLDLALQSVKTVEEERDFWRQQAEESAEKLRIEKDGFKQQEGLRHSYIVPAPSDLMDGNNDVLLSPAPLARSPPRTPPGIPKLSLRNSSESGTAFLPLPFPDNEDSHNGSKLPATTGPADERTGGATHDVSPLMPTRGISSGSSRPLVEHPVAGESSAYNTAVVNPTEWGRTMNRNDTMQKDAAESTYRHVPMARPRKRAKLGRKSTPGRSSLETKNGSSGLQVEAEASGSAVKATECVRTLRSGASASQIHSQVGDDIAATSAGREVDQSEIQLVTRSKSKKAAARKTEKLALVKENGQVDQVKPKRRQRRQSARKAV